MRQNEKYDTRISNKTKNGDALYCERLEACRDGALQLQTLEEMLYKYYSLKIHFKKVKKNVLIMKKQ